MTRYAARTDDGVHQEIAEGFKRLGIWYLDIHAAGLGIGDFLTLHLEGYPVFLEAKQPENRRRLTDKELRFHQEINRCDQYHYVVCSFDEALAACGRNPVG